MADVYLALYKGKAKRRWHRIIDSLIRFATGSKYSHCEIAVERLEFAAGEQRPDISYDCYSSSPRDGGVRCKRINVADKSKWDLILLDITEEQVEGYFEQTKGAKYDIAGALGVVFPLYNRSGKYFCSEWCANVIFDVHHKWTISPAKLAELATKKEVFYDKTK